MSNVMIDADAMTSIADAIRDKTKTSDSYLPSEMADAIKSISGGSGYYNAMLYEIKARRLTDD